MNKTTLITAALLTMFMYGCSKDITTTNTPNNIAKGPSNMVTYKISEVLYGNCSWDGQSH